MYNVKKLYKDRKIVIDGYRRDIIDKITSMEFRCNLLMIIDDMDSKYFLVGSVVIDRGKHLIPEKYLNREVGSESRRKYLL